MSSPVYIIRGGARDLHELLYSSHHSKVCNHNYCWFPSYTAVSYTYVYVYTASHC